MSDECPGCGFQSLIPIYRFTSDCGHDSSQHTTAIDVDGGDEICLDSPVGESRCDECGDHVSDPSDELRAVTEERDLLRAALMRVVAVCVEADMEAIMNGPGMVETAVIHRALMATPDPEAEVTA